MAETESGSYTPETISRRQKMAELLLSESLKPQKITHWAEGLAQLGRAGVGGYMAGEAEREQKTGEANSREFLAKLLAGGGASAVAPAAPPVSPPAASPDTPMGALPGMPRGLRNNNPLNIENGSFTQGQPGYAGDDGRFAKFASMDQGVGAANKLLDTYKNKYGLDTAAGIVGRWAPTSDGNNVSAYAGNIAKALGIDPNSPIPPEMRDKLVAAMAQQENGRPLPQQQMAQVAPQSQTQPATAGAPPNPMADKIAQALRSNDPYIAKAAQGLAGGLITKQFAPPKYHKLNDEQLFDEGTGAVKAAGPGFQPLVDPKERAKFGIPIEDKRPYQLGPGNKLINPPPETRLNIDQRNEAAFEQAAGKHQAERFDKLVSGGMDAKAMSADLNALKDIGSRITTGKTAEIQAAIGPYAEALGVKMDGLDDLQAYKSIVAKLAPRMRVVGSGATSDYEMRQFLEALPGLGKTQGGNEMISTTLQALQDHKETAAEIASKAMNKELTPREADKMLRELPDPLTAWKKNKGQPTLQATKPPAANIDDLLKKYGGSQ